MKTCTKCKIEKEESDFNKKSSKGDALRPRCKECYRLENREREKSQEYKDKKKKYREEHPDEDKERKRKYYLLKGDDIRRQSKIWRQTFTGRLHSYKMQAKNRNIGWEMTNEDFMSFWQKPCTYCNSPIDTIGLDRIITTESYNINNVTPCCYQCNIMKMDYSILEFKNKIIEIYKNLKLWEHIEKRMEI